VQDFRAGIIFTTEARRKTGESTAKDAEGAKEGRGKAREGSPQIAQIGADKDEIGRASCAGQDSAVYAGR
jgi:hypothetical protein